MSAETKIIHAADLHLGASVKCPAFDGFDPVEAPWQAFERLIDLCLSERVSALLLAGDQFDSGDPHPQTEKRFYAQIERLNAANVPVFMVLGNHDAAFFAKQKFAAPSNLTLFAADHPETVELGDTIVIHGRSYPSGVPGTVGTDFALSYPAAAGGALNIGLLHSSLESPDWAPISVKDLLARGYDYWALGHEHKPQVFGELGAQAAYPGNLQGRDIGEQGTRGANILHIRGREIVAIEPKFFGGAQWQELEVDISAHNDASKIEHALRQAVEGVDTRIPQILRVTMTGQSALHADAYRQQAHLTNALNEGAPSRLIVASVRTKVAPLPERAAAVRVDWPLDRADVNADALSTLTKKLNSLGLIEVSPAPDLDQAERIARSILGQSEPAS